MYVDTHDVNPPQVPLSSGCAVQEWTEQCWHAGHFEGCAQLRSIGPADNPWDCQHRWHRGRGHCHSTTFIQQHPVWGWSDDCWKEPEHTKEPERSPNIQNVLSTSDTASARLEGIVPVAEDWHAKMCLYKVNSTWLSCGKSSHLLWYNFTQMYKFGWLICKFGCTEWC